MGRQDKDIIIHRIAAASLLFSNRCHEEDMISKVKGYHKTNKQTNRE